MLARTRFAVARVVLVALAAFAGLSCSQYEYSSPLPGILEVRLAVKNNRQSLLPFSTLDSTTGAQNQFQLVVTNLEMFAPGELRLPIFASLVAIQRNENGDPYNSLDVAARDSVILMGTGYTPPGAFDRMEIRIVPSPVVVLSYGFYNSFIPVEIEGILQDLITLPAPGQPPVSIPIQEGRTTVVTVTYDMDESLRQRAEWFDYSPAFYISSVILY